LIINQFQSVIALIFLAFTLALADELPAAPAPRGYQEEPSYAPASYAYNWAVKDDYSKNDYGQQEERNGDVTTGSYRVALPDGRIQTVTYSVSAYGGYQGQSQFTK
jgi:hypothetical protein